MSPRTPSVFFLDRILHASRILAFCRPEYEKLVAPLTCLSSNFRISGFPPIYLPGKTCVFTMFVLILRMFVVSLEERSISSITDIFVIFLTDLLRLSVLSAGHCILRLSLVSISVVCFVAAPSIFGRCVRNVACYSPQFPSARLGHILSGSSSTPLDIPVHGISRRCLGCKILPKRFASLVCMPGRFLLVARICFVCW